MIDKSSQDDKPPFGRQPGDLNPREQLERIIRVDHAGEFGAVRIYEGQLAVLGKTESGETLRHMRDQELVHREKFEQLLAERRVRPTLLGPVWHVAGFALGAGTALLGKEAAMACTEAVEEVIDAHYREQLDTLGEDETELKETISRFRDEEIEHRDTAREAGASEAPAYELLTTAVKAGSKLAIWLSSRI
ncbi:MAG: demethoxyubiquinone hydroxylase family protein [Sneathiella sp.]|jgi:ubiquinone biosynthesis monooxygenase Coq7|uniref:demethoxyubiquinone hydroxylase family protein n=1 Tax=Sneathiella sp. TaxID=1964365 RepID=UPI000C674D98|nr:demethoxyubiquinone hydroxylase family protein [Sneathiella sp.]MAL79419.1 demethoxyubiquinone hydroxylase family protein [Sneathiella sp.]|tara:strand:- start:224 stop:796 length:573 start_codon:yes stop_codon:yes gene_type:complete